MRHPLWYRLFIAVWGLWFTTALVEPAGAHSCPMHGGHTAHVTQTAGVNEGAPTHSVHDVARHAPEKQSRAVCTCLGRCCSAAPIAVPPLGPELAVALGLDDAGPIGRDETAVVVRRDYSQPFANGPPRSFAL